MAAVDGQPAAVLDVSLDPVHDRNVNQLRTLNRCIFPVRYQDKVYADAMTAGEFSSLAHYTDIVVGGIACRCEKASGGARLYIMTLGVLPAYRGRGVGSQMVRNAIKLAEQDPNFLDVYLHVQTSNDEAVSFYKKLGFEVRETVKGYYKRLDPPDAYLIARPITHTPKPEDCRA